MKILSKISMLVFLLVASTGAVVAENLIKITDFEIKPGDTKTIDVVLSTDVEVGNFNFKVYLPEGLSFEGDNGSYTYTDIYQGSMKGANIQADGGLYFMGSLTGGVPAPAGEAVLATFKVTASNTFDGGEIEVKNLKINKERPAEYKVKVTATKDTPIVGNKIIIEDFAIKPGDTQVVDVILATEVEVGNFNFKVYLPEGLSFAGENGNYVYTDLYKGSMKGANIQADGGLYFMGSLTGGTPAPAGKAVLASFYVTASNTFTGGKMQVKNLKINKERPEEYTVTVAITTGIDAIQTISDNAVIYNIAGQRVNANAKGLVIKNGKKFINK